jgi:hypothetical protein
VLGYKLYMGESGSSSYTLVYDGSLNSATLAYNVTGLTTGSYYTFYVIAINYNGESDSSNELETPVCLAPSSIAAPYYITST